MSNAYRPLQKILICNVFALPTVAQQTNAPDPKLHEEFIAGDKKFDAGFINGDAAALANRLEHDRETEIILALEEISKIARLRLMDTIS